MTDEILTNDEVQRDDDRTNQAEHDDLQARADAMIQSALADDDEDTTADPATTGEPDETTGLDETLAAAEETEAQHNDPVGPQSETNEDNATAALDEAEQQASDAQPKARKKLFDDVSFDRAYRINVYYRVEDGQYGLHCAELGDLNVKAETRALALAQAEQAIEDRISEFAVQGIELPKPFDLDLRRDYSGEIKLKVGKSLHRDLSVAARREKVSLNHLASDLLSAGLAILRAEGRTQPGRDGQNRNRNDRGTKRGSSRGDNRRDIRRRGGMSEGRYKQVMEDKGAFMEYVRGLDSEGNNPRGGNSRGRRRR